MRKRLVVCCDGTWNTADQPSPTNVCKLRDAVRPGVLDDGVEQRVYYDAGVGTGRFAPALWEQQPEGRGRQTLEQVWFAGVHTDVGGGYPESGLSDITLRWMLARAAACGLELDAPPLAPDFRAPLHDSMTWYYRAFGRFARPLGAPRLDERGVPLETHEAAANTAVARLGQPPALGRGGGQAGQHVDRCGRIDVTRQGGPS